MNLTKFEPSKSEQAKLLFRNSFGDSEGQKEGESIALLVQELIETTADSDLHGYCAQNGKDLIGCIFFSRLSVANESSVFMLSPVAVATEYQRKGIGQRLIRFGLDQLKSEGVEIIVTYGDPNYYSKVGFEPLAENTISAPYALTYPEGWQAQSLSGRAVSSIIGKAQCVKAFRKQEYW